MSEERNLTSPQNKKILKLTSALIIFSRSIEKLFSVDCVNIYLFSIFFSIDFAREKSVGLPQIAYIVIH